MREKIPERISVTCDSCKIDMTDSKNQHDARLIIKANALDGYGSAVASANCEFDLCDDCYLKITETLRKEYHIR